MCLQQHGIVSTSPEGIKINYFRILSKNSTVTVKVERDIANRSNLLHFNSQIHSMNDLSGEIFFKEFLQKDELTYQAKLAFTLLCDHPISISINGLNQLLEAGYSLNDSKVTSKDISPSLNFGTTIGGSFYSFKSKQYPVSIQVSRIPFLHLSQLKKMFQIMRQQIILNELFNSCFCSDAVAAINVNVVNNKKRKFNDNTDKGLQVEVSVEDEFLYLDINAQSKISIFVAPNGRVDATLEIQNSNLQRFLAELNRTFSIPQALSLIVY